MKHPEKATFFDRLHQGMKESIAYSRGQLNLKTTELPAPPPRTKPRQIAQLRQELRMSQAVFAATINVSTRTVQSWEHGNRQPADAALRMLQIIREHRQVIQTLFAPKDTAPPRNGLRLRRRRLQKASV